MFTERKNELVYRRTVRAIQNHFWTLFQQAGIAFAVASLWYVVIWLNQAHIQAEDRDIYLVGLFAFVSLNWILKATELLHFVLEQHRAIVKAAKRADRDTIIDLKDDHVPLLLPLYLCVLACIIEGMVMFMPFTRAADGFCAVFIATLVFCFYAALIYELEDPTEGGWVRDEVLKYCPEVLDIDSEEEFAKRWKRQFGARLREAGNTDPVSATGIVNE